MKNFQRERLYVLLGFLVVSLLLISIAPALAQTKKFHFKLGSTSVRSGLYAPTVAMAGIINRAYPGEIIVTVVETGGYLENLERLRRGTIHAGPSATSAGAASYLGLLDWKGKPDKNLRSLWGGWFTLIHFISSKKSGITTIEGFDGKPFAFNPGSTSGWAINYFLKAIDVKPKYKLLGIGASPDAMKSGVVDGWYKAGWKDAAIMDIEAVMEINIVPIKPEHLAKAEKLQPGIHRSMTIPAHLFKSVKSEQLSYAAVVTEFVRKDVPEDVVYKIVKAIWEQRATLVDSMAPLRVGHFEDMIGNAVKFNLKIPFHAGAVKYYREIGQTIPPGLIPPEAR